MHDEPMATITRQDLFPTPIWFSMVPDHETLNSSLLDTILEEQSSHPQGITASNVQGWHSRDNLHRRSQFQDLLKCISRDLMQVARELKWQLEQVKPTISTCWANVNPKHSFNVLHNHPNSILSGVYYVTVPENSGDLYFHDPKRGYRMLVPPVSSETPWSVGKAAYTPCEGKLVIFPSWLWHGVEPNLSDETRVSISFNVGVAKL